RGATKPGIGRRLASGHRFGGRAMRRERTAPMRSLRVPVLIGALVVSCAEGAGSGRADDDGVGGDPGFGGMINAGGAPIGSSTTTSVGVGGDTTTTSTTAATTT